MHPEAIRTCRLGFGQGTADPVELSEIHASVHLLFRLLLREWFGLASRGLARKIRFFEEKLQ